MDYVPPQETRKKDESLLHRGGLMLRADEALDLASQTDFTRIAKDASRLIYTMVMKGRSDTQSTDADVLALLERAGYEVEDTYVRIRSTRGRHIAGVLPLEAAGVVSDYILSMHLREKSKVVLREVVESIRVAAVDGKKSVAYPTMHSNPKLYTPSVRDVVDSELIYLGYSIEDGAIKWSEPFSDSYTTHVGLLRLSREDARRLLWDGTPFPVASYTSRWLHMNRSYDGPVDEYIRRYQTLIEVSMKEVDRYA